MHSFVIIFVRFSGASWQNYNICCLGDTFISSFEFGKKRSKIIINNDSMDHSYENGLVRLNQSFLKTFNKLIHYVQLFYVQATANSVWPLTIEQSIFLFPSSIFIPKSCSVSRILHRMQFLDGNSPTTFRLFV